MRVDLFDFELPQERIALRPVRPRDAALYTSIPLSTLAKLRMRANRAKGPKVVKISGCVIYRKSDLDEWMEQNVVEATVS